MEPSDIQFVGAPCGQHGPYTFYKAFKYSKDGKQRILALGEFFFVRILENMPICLGELQLLWEDKNQDDQLLTSVRLYFLPEDTPEGFQKDYHGKDEVLAENDKVVLRLQDLVSWIVNEEEVTWTRGGMAFGEKGKPSDRDMTEYTQMVEAFTANNCSLPLKDVKEEKKLIGSENYHHSPVQILSYPQYCRHKTMMRRLENTNNSWLTNALVCSLGGGLVTRGDVRILFCRDTIQHPDLEEHEFRQDHLAPNLKGRRRKRKLVSKKDADSDSYSDSLDSSDSCRLSGPQSAKQNGARFAKFNKMENPLFPRQGLPKPPADEEEFLQRLYKFMKKFHKPITRLPTLGFKEGKVDLYFFFNYAQKLGGYEVITQKRLWKHIYDQLGGNPSNTSAATCTRRHYEKLLLPFERHLNGEDDKPLPVPYKKPVRKKAPTDLLPTGSVDNVKLAATVESPQPQKRAKLGLRKQQKFNPHLAAKEMQWERMRREKHWTREQTKPNSVKNELEDETENPAAEEDFKNHLNPAQLKYEPKQEQERSESSSAPHQGSTDARGSPAKLHQVSPGNIAMMPVMQGPVVMQGGAIMPPLILQNLPPGLNVMRSPESGVPYLIPAMPSHMQVQVPNSSMAVPKPIIISPTSVSSPFGQQMSPSTALSVPTTASPNVASPAVGSYLTSKADVSRAQKRKSGPRSQRPSVIKHTRTAPKEILNPAPVPRPYMPKAVYGPPDSGIAGSHGSPLQAKQLRPVYSPVQGASNSHFTPPKAHAHSLPVSQRPPTTYLKPQDAAVPDLFTNTMTSVLGVRQCISRGQQFIEDQQLHQQKVATPILTVPKPSAIPTNDDQPADLSMKSVAPKSLPVAPPVIRNQQQQQPRNGESEQPMNLAFKPWTPPRSNSAERSQTHTPSGVLSREQPELRTSRLESQRHSSISPPAAHSKKAASQAAEHALPNDPSSAIHPAFPQHQGLSKVMPQGAVPVNPFPQINPQYLYQTPVPTSNEKQSFLSATPLYRAAGMPPFAQMPSQLYPPWYAPPSNS